MSSLVARPLGLLTWSLAAAPAYLARHGSPRSPEELVEHECLRILRKGPEIHWELSRGAGRARRVPIGGRFEVTDGTALASALYAGIGIGVRLRSEIEAAVEAQRLEHVLDGWQWARTPVYAMFAQRQAQSPRGARAGRGTEEHDRTTGLSEQTRRDPLAAKSSNPGLSSVLNALQPLGAEHPADPPEYQFHELTAAGGRWPIAPRGRKSSPGRFP